MASPSSSPWPIGTRLASGVMLNRSAVIVKPRRPYLEWARQDDPEGLAESVFEALRAEPSVYLLPEHEDPATQRAILEELRETIA